MNSHSTTATSKPAFSGRPLLRAAAFAGFLAMGFASAASMAQAQTHCDAIGPSCGCDQCGHAPSTRNNPLYKTLDTLAGGIEHVFGLDRCNSCRCASGGCDSPGGQPCGCGGSGSSSSRAPMPPLQHGTIVPTPMPASPGTMSPRPAPMISPTAPRSMTPRLPSVPPLDTNAPEPRVTQPELSTPSTGSGTEPGDSAPESIDAADSAPPTPSTGQPQSGTGSSDLTAPRIVPTNPDAAPRLPRPEDTLPTPNQPQEGIFDRMDNLDDPFKEDASIRRLPYGSVRPATLRRYVPQNRPAPKSRSGGISPSASQPIGSGLRPVQHLAPLRPVSHNQPIGLSPLGGGKVLAPYRRSR